jgi:hypothetical protein
MSRSRRIARRAVRNVRSGRLQRSLSLTTGLTSLPLAFEIYLEHYKGSFADPWEWAPIACTPALLAAAVGGYRSERAARTWLPAMSALYGANGVIGTALHLRGVHRRPGGFREPTYNLVMGPPLLAPGSLMLVGAIGLLAAVARREH